MNQPTTNIDEDLILHQMNANKDNLKCELDGLSFNGLQIESLSAHRKEYLIKWFINFYKYKDPSKPLVDYFVPVHEQESCQVHHGLYIDIPSKYSFINAIIQLFVALEKSCKFPLTLPTHHFRYIFDNYGKDCQLRPILESFLFIASPIEERNWMILFFHYFLSEISVPIMMRFILHVIRPRMVCQISSACTNSPLEERPLSIFMENYYIKLNVRSLSNEVYPRPLSLVMR